MNKWFAIKLLFLALLMSCGNRMFSQSYDVADLIKAYKIDSAGEELSIALQFDVKSLNIRSDEMVSLSLTLISNDDFNDKYSFAPIVVAGNLRHKIMSRKLKFEQKAMSEHNLPNLFRLSSHVSQLINTNWSLLMQPWMNDASLVAKFVLSGCADCRIIEQDLLISSDILPHIQKRSDTDLIPLKVTFIEPEIEKIKNRSEQHVASFNFIQASYRLIRDYKDNALKFAEVDRVIRKIKNNEDLKVKEFSIVGYASPDGNSAQNDALAFNRAKAFADYLVSKFKLPEELFVVDSKGEDWEGLIELIQDSDFAEKQIVLDAIKQAKNVENRNQALRDLLSAAQYQFIYDNFYPKLRRTTYKIDYVVRPYDVEEAKHILHQDPKHLSLFELYQIAETLGANSNESRRIYEIIGVLFPESEIANINRGANEILCGNYSGAIELMSDFSDNSKTWNNLGVAYFLNNDFEKGTFYFEKAASQGDADAVENLQIVKTWME